MIGTTSDRKSCMVNPGVTIDNSVIGAGSAVTKDYQNVVAGVFVGLFKK